MKTRYFGNLMLAQLYKLMHGQSIHAFPIECDPELERDVKRFFKLLEDAHKAVEHSTLIFGPTQRSETMATKKKETVESVRENLGLVHPLIAHRNLMAAFLGQDPDVTVDLDKESQTFNIIVTGCEHKAEAMRQLFNGTFILGAFKCKLLVNGKAKSHKTIVTEECINAALTGNPLFSRLYVARDEEGKIFEWTVLLKQTTVMFPNDNRCSPWKLECYDAEHLCKYAFHGKINSVMQYATETGKEIDDAWLK